MCCCCLDSIETIRSVLNAASHWAPLWLVCQHRLDLNCLLKCDSVCCAVHSNPTEISWIGESKLIRFEQAVQIQPVLTDTPISRGTEWECVFFTEKPSVPSNMFGKSLFCSSVLQHSLFIAVWTGKKKCSPLFQRNDKRTCHMYAFKIKRQNRGLWRIMVLLVGQGGGSSRRDGVTTKSLQLVEEAQETSAPQCLLSIQCD